MFLQSFLFAVGSILSIAVAAEASPANKSLEAWSGLPCGKVLGPFVDSPLTLAWGCSPPKRYVPLKAFSWVVVVLTSLLVTNVSLQMTNVEDWIRSSLSL